MTAPILALLLLLAPLPAAAEIVLPTGFSAQVYVTGEGFDSDSTRAARGIPSTPTMAFDATGALYLARSGRRYAGGEQVDLWPLYRIPPGGARVTPETERRFLHGPPLINPQVAGTRRGKDLLVTTFDRERKIGALYRLADGRAELLAGGTPPRGTPALFQQAEGAAVDAGGNVYVADRAQNVVVRLDGDGQILDRRYLAVTRPRLLATDDRGQVWVASDGTVDSPAWRAVSTPAAAIFNLQGNLLALREDAGRHNAVDKVLGWGFLENKLPFDSHILLVSGRASFEIVQKALAARIPIIAAVSAPSSLAVEFAQESIQTLIGFLRDRRMNIYANAQRVAFHAAAEARR